MSKAFTRELEGDEDGAAADLPRDFTNDITPAGLAGRPSELAISDSARIGFDRGAWRGYDAAREV